MTRIQWTEPAREDLRQIHSYIVRDSRQYASRMIARIKKAVQGIRRFPLSGARVDEWDQEDLREIFVDNYRVIYRVTDDVILVLTVVHGSRLLPDANAE